MDYEKPRLFEIDTDRAQGNCQPTGNSDTTGHCKTGTRPLQNCQDGNDAYNGNCNTGTGR